MAANWAIIVLLINKPAFNALRAVLVPAGAPYLSNLHQNVTACGQPSKNVHTDWFMPIVSMHNGQASSPASAATTGAHWSSMCFLLRVSLTRRRLARAGQTQTPNSEPILAKFLKAENVGYEAIIYICSPLNRSEGIEHLTRMRCVNVRT